MAADPHNWASWQEYLNVHTKKLEGYAGFFLLDDQLRPTLLPKLVSWTGVLYCADGIEIRVVRLQDVRMRGGIRQVITREYTYEVIQRIGPVAKQILRYDNIGNHGHADKHHRHTYDEYGVGTVEWVGHKDWPNLGQVIDEVYDRWQRWKSGEAKTLTTA